MSVTQTATWCSASMSIATRGLLLGTVLRSANPDHRLVQPCALARRTAARLEQPVAPEHVMTRLAARRNDLDRVPRGANRAKQVLQVELHVGARGAQLARERRH